jgi:drug/metabolite transporter (DMT)-like permease
MTSTYLDTVPRAAPNEPGMPRLLGLGLLAAALFSVTFVLNRAMSLAGGHWAWSAALRYVDMAILLALWLSVRHGVSRLAAVLRLFRRQLGFWLLAGGIGYGVFYTGICYAANHAPGWIIAATWQVTILATPLVLRGFGVRVPLRGVAFAAVIVLGILILNAQRLASGIAFSQVLQGVLPVMIAALAYPIGNQLVNRARHGGEAGAVLADPAAAVLLLTLGALPFFGGLLLLTTPPPPSGGQLMSTAIIAVVAGGFATTLFLHARNLSSDAWRIAAVDATQAGEVAFALLGEMLLLGAAAPDLFGVFGLAAVMGGLAGFIFRSKTAAGAD